MECPVCGLDHNQAHDSELWTTADDDGNEVSLDRLSYGLFQLSMGEAWASGVFPIVKVKLKDLRRLRDVIDELDSEF